MKTVVITGSTRGLGFEMARQFCLMGFNVVINGVNKERLEEAVLRLRDISQDCKVEGFAGNVSSLDSIKKLSEHAVRSFGSIDIWINNAGVNQPMKAIWELTEDEISLLIDIDLKGAVMGSRIAMMLGLNIYGTSKRAVTHFTKAFAKELSERGSKVKAGRLSPGILFTDFMTNSLGGKEQIALSEKTKRFYNIMGDHPDVVARFLVSRIIKNTKNNAHIEWLTGGKVLRRLIMAPICKRKPFYE